MVAKFNVQHGLSLYGIAVCKCILDVAPGGFAVADTGHEIGTLVFAETIVQTCFGVKEQVVLVEVDIFQVIGHSTQFVVHSAQLQVGIGIEVGVEVIVGFGIHAVISFVSMVAVPFKLLRQLEGCVAHPYHIAIVVAVEVQ